MRPLAFASCLLLIAATLPAQFSAPVNVTEVNSSTQDYYPYISADNLTMRIGSDRTDIPGSPGGWDIYVAKRNNPHSLFGAVSREPGLINGSTNDVSPHMLSSELVAYTANSGSGGAGGHDIWRFTRTGPTASWGAGTNVTAVNTSGTEYGVSVTDDDLYMLTISGSNVVEATRPDVKSPWGSVRIATELNAGTGRRDMGMSLDGLTVYYGVTGFSGGPGGYDILKATRVFRSNTWGAPQLVANINATGTDRSPKPSPDGRQLFFSSDRSGGVGGQDVWVSYFTGLSYQNLPQIASPVLLHVTHPQKPGEAYQIGLSLSNNIGIRIPNVGTIPLDLDNLLILSVQNSVPGLFIAFAGKLDINGEATGQLNIPPSIGLVGIPFHAAAVLYNAKGISYISNGLHLGIHR
jgi:hypothetical protein